MTSLFRGCEVGPLPGNMGVVDPAWEKAKEPLECDTAAEEGREAGVLLESRDLDTLLDKRRSHF